MCQKNNFPSKIIIIFILFIVTISTYSQNKEKKSFWNKLKGKQLASAITFLPVGSHTTDIDFIGVYYTSYNYKSLEFAVFRNSFKDPTFMVTYKREIPLSDKLSLMYGAGLMYGYKGRLQNTSGIPFRKTFLFTGNINPTAGIELDYKISKKVSFHANIASLVFVYGLRYWL